MKFNIKKFVIVMVCIIVGSFLISGIILYTTGGVKAALVNQANIVESKEYLASDFDEIIINSVSSKVNIIPVTIAEKKIRAELYGSVNTNLANVNPKLLTNTKNKTLFIELSYPKTINIGLINIEKLYLDVYIPKNFGKNITVKSVSAEINLRDINLNELKINSVSGSVAAQDLDAKKINIETTSGRVYLNKISGNTVAKTVSGEVNLYLNELIGNIDINTISGKASVSLPKDSKFILNIKTVSGSIENEFESNVSYIDRNTIEAIIGGEVSTNSSTKEASHQESNVIQKSNLHQILIKTTSGAIEILKQNGL